MEYHLYPPFFVIEPESRFSDAWESFCWRVLSLAENTNGIVRFTPPESGIDLYWSSRRIAYQCKAVELGSAGRFPTDHAIESLGNALKVRGGTLLPWDEYYICCNVNITGEQLEKIRKSAPEADRARIMPLGLDYWRTQCEKFAPQLDDRFNQLIRLRPRDVAAAVDERYLRKYKSQLQADDPHLRTTTLCVASRKRQNLFQIPVDESATVQELITIICALFKLPREGVYGFGEDSVSFSYHVLKDGQALLPDQGVLTLGSRSVVSLEKGIHVISADGESHDFIVERLTNRRYEEQQVRRQAQEELKTRLEHLFDSHVDAVRAQFGHSNED